MCTCYTYSRSCLSFANRRIVKEQGSWWLYQVYTVRSVSSMASLSPNQPQAVILSVSRRRANREQPHSSLFPVTLTSQRQLHGTRMFMKRLNPFLKPVFTRRFCSHYGCSAATLSNLKRWLSMFGAAYWCSGCLLPQFASDGKQTMIILQNGWDLNNWNTVTVWTCDQATVLDWHG